MGDVDILVQYLGSQSIWFQCEVLDIIKSGVLKKFEEDFAELKDMTTEELLKFPYTEHGPDTKYPKLAKFFERFKEYSIMGAKAAVLPKWEIPPELFHKVKEKKAYELNQIVPLIVTELRKANITAVIDIGCGVGNMLRMLNHYGFQTVGIESNPEYAEVAKTNNPKSQIFEVFLDQDNTFDLLVNLAHQFDAPTAIISLHGCGDLQSDILTTFSLVDRVDFPVLVTVGCCYTKRSSARPMSETVSSAFEKYEWEINFAGLRLAGDRGLPHWRESTVEAFKYHSACMFKRALIHLCFAECRDYRSYRGKIPDLPDDPDEMIEVLFADYSRERDEQFFATKADMLVKIKELEQYKPWMERLAFMQAGIQGLLESLVQLDAYYYLIENGLKNPSLIPVFDAYRSPRNMAIISNFFD